jgi:glutathione S-transferase
MSPYTLIIGNKNYSSWSLRAWLMLKQAGVEFEEIRIALDLPNTRRQILQYSPTGKVPVLLHNGITIWESIAIGEYIAEQFPDRQLLPVKAEVRAIARAIGAEMHAGFQPLRQQMPMDCRGRYPNSSMSPEVQADIDRITNLWRNCREQFGSKGDFLFGHFTLADAMYAPVTCRFVTYGVSLDAVSQAYIDTVWALPAMREWLAAAAIESEVIENP